MRKHKNEVGCWVYSFGETRTVVEEKSSTLDLDAITKTLSAMRAWLESSPSTEDVSSVVEYEKAHANRSGAVGDEGCLTLYLKGE